MSISVTIAVLAGDQSKRMGTDKSLVSFRGQPLISHVLEKVSQLSLPIILIANHHEPYRSLGFPIFSDVRPGKGSLGGLYTALFHSSTPHTLCVACDMPCLNPSLLRYLIDQCQDYDAVIPRIDNLPQAFHAVYRRSCLSLVEKRVQQGHLKLRDLFPMMNCRYVDTDEIKRFDPLLSSFTNVNTPEALVG